MTQQTAIATPAEHGRHIELVLEEPLAPHPPKRPSDDAPARILAPRSANWLSETMLEMSPTCPKPRTVVWIVSMALHTLMVGAILAAPLFSMEAIDLKQLAGTLLVAPPPPPPPPPPAQSVVKMARAPRSSFISGGKLLAPIVIPQKVAILKEEPFPSDLGAGVEGGVPGGVAGGQLGGVIGGILGGGANATPPAPPPLVRSKAPVRVGGQVKPPRLILRVPPVYPTLARQARIQGEVLIDAVIDTQGNVVEMHAVSGPALLIPAALEAVGKWKYEPTFLNGQPVELQLIVTVKFNLM